MRVLVTGATGFIGSHLVDRLLADGHEVTVLVRPASNRRWLAGKPLRWASGTLDDAAALAAAVAGQEIVFHLAGSVRAIVEADFEPANVRGMQNLVAALLAASPRPAKVVHLSSLEAGGPSGKGRARNEEDLDAPVSAYGESKRRGEEVLRAASGELVTVILRPPVVYGPRDIGVLEFYKLARWGLRLALGRGERWAAMIYVDDLVEALCRAASASTTSGEIFYIDDMAPARSWREMQDAVAASAGRKPGRTLRVPEWIFHLVCTAGQWTQQLTGRLLWINRTRFHSLTQRVWSCDSGKIQRVLGYQARVDLREGLARTARWYREQGWIR